MLRGHLVSARVVAAGAGEIAGAAGKRGGEGNAGQAKEEEKGEASAPEVRNCTLCPLGASYTVAW